MIFGREPIEEVLTDSLNAPFVKGQMDVSVFEGLDRSTPLLIYCDGGYRSRPSLPVVNGLGFDTIYHLHRGLMSWRFFGGPIETGEITTENAE